MEKRCINCGHEFENKSTDFCSTRCVDAYFKASPNSVACEDEVQ